MPSGPPTASAPNQRTPLRQVATRLWPFLKPHMRAFVLGAGVALVGSLLALLIPQALRAIVDGPLSSGDASAVWPAGLVILALGIAEVLAVYFRRVLVLGPSTNLEASLRNALYSHLQKLPVAFHDRWQSGQLLSRATQDLGLIRRFMAFGFVLLITNVLTIVVAMVILISWNWVLGLVFFALNVPMVLISYRFEQAYSRVSRQSQDLQGDLATTVEQSVHGIRVLKAFGRGRHALEGFAQQALGVQRVEIDKAKLDGFIWFWLIVIPQVSYGVCLFLGIWFAAEGSMSVGDLVGFLTTAAVLRWPIESLGFLYAFGIDASNAGTRFFEVMDATVTVDEPEQPVVIRQPRGRLVFDDARFRYQDAPEGERDLVNGATLAIEPGETMALVGVTGSGKTTMTALPARLYDVTGGRVTLDGVDVRELSLDELHGRIAMAFEDATLFSSSVRDNVLLGHPGGTDADVEEALRIAQATFAYDLPDGLDTKVGEEGMSLSGGQRQRLALARAIAARPDVLVLDDPLSALDVDTERQVEDALRHVLASTTALIVAHRPSTVQLADRVALMRDGRIVDVGTHSEMLARNDHYRYVISSLEDDEKRQEVNL